MKRETVLIYASDPSEDVVRHQILTLEQYAHERGMEIKGEFFDIGSEAKAKRYGLLEAKNAIASGEKCILAWNAQKLAKDLCELSSVVKEIESLGGKVICCQEGELSSIILTFARVTALLEEENQKKRK